MMTLSKQRKFTFNSLLENIRGSKCCVIKVRQYMFEKKFNGLGYAKDKKNVAVRLQVLPKTSRYYGN